MPNFHQQPQTDKIYFKGGTASRMSYISHRFSEDPDFNSSLTRIHPIEQAVLEMLEEIERENIHPELNESKRTSGKWIGMCD